MKNYMKYFLLMGLVSVAMALDEYRVTNSDDARLAETYAEHSQDEGDVVPPVSSSHWFTNPSN